MTPSAPPWPPLRRVSWLLDDAHVNYRLAAAAERDGEHEVARWFRNWAHANEREAGRLLARPLAPGPQGVEP